MLRSGSASRFASAAAASSRASATRASSLAALPLVDGDEAHDEGDDEGDGEGRELDPEPPVGAGLALDAFRFTALLPVACVPAGVDELALPGRQGIRAAFGGLERDLEPRPAVERPGVAVEIGPGRGGVAQLAHGDDGLTVLVDPGPQPGPLAQQRLVGDLDGRLAGRGMAIKREQPGLRPRPPRRRRWTARGAASPARSEGRGAGSAPLRR